MDLLWIAGSYLLGSIPAAYIVARALRGIDIRHYGTGNVGGGNVWEQVSFSAFLLVALADIGKGVLAVEIARLLGVDLWMQVACGWAAILGHNYSIFLRGRGGKGLSALIGAMLVLAPGEALTFIVLSVLHYLLRRLGILSPKNLARLPASISILFEGGVWTLISFAAILLLALVLREPLPIMTYIVVAIALHLIKRVQDIQPPWQIPKVKREVLINRLFLDRDMIDYDAWIHRNPEDLGGTAGEGKQKG